MGHIYRNSVLTIAAIGANDSSEGCFNNREGLFNRPCQIWKETPSFFEEKPNVYAFCNYERDPNDIMRNRGPLDTRAWVLQEQLLSPRVLNYGSNDVYWECLTAEITEAIPEGAPTKNLDDREFVQVFKAALTIDLQDAESQDFHRFLRAWYLTVENYSRRELTKETDRLIALSGLASETQNVTGNLYFAGLWGSKYFWRDLLWSVHAPGCPTVGSSFGYKGEVGPPSSRYTEFKGESTCQSFIIAKLSSVSLHADYYNHSAIMVLGIHQRPHPIR